MNALRNFLHLIKFEHTVFALPFAYLGMVLAAGGWPGWSKFFWITFAMVAARTLAMGVNRIADRWYDARNPRTMQRPLVTGKISLRTAQIGTAISAALLVLAAAMLGLLPLLLLPGAIVFLIGYSFTKRFTAMSHFILGFTDGLAPLGAWVAVTGSIFTLSDLPGWILLVVVTLWIGGFDMMYACQDTEFDREYKLWSIPARYGNAAALRLARVSHAAMLMLLAALGAWMGLSWPYWAALGVTAALLIWEHSLVRPDDLSKMDMAFFNINSYIAITLFAGALGGILL